MSQKALANATCAMSTESSPIPTESRKWPRWPSIAGVGVCSRVSAGASAAAASICGVIRSGNAWVTMPQTGTSAGSAAASRRMRSSGPRITTRPADS